MAIRVGLTCAPDASGYYRIEQPTRHVDQGDFDTLILYSGLGIVFDFSTQPPTYKGLLETPFDLMILQRPMFYFMPDVIRDLQGRGIPVIVEIDDDFHTADHRNRGFNLNHPRVNPAQNWQHLGKCIQLADHVTVSTDALAERYGAHGRVSVLRNYATDEWLSLPRRGDGRTLGWPGSTLNHPDDPQATQGAIPQFMAEYRDWTFSIVGGEKYRDEAIAAFGWVDIMRTPTLANRIQATPWKPLELHPYLVSTIDLGIVPLADTKFNAAKSWLKGLEFAALGIPFVASARPEYLRLEAKFGIGHTVPVKRNRWERALSQLARHEHMREEVGQSNRATVQAKLTMSKNAYRWAEVWQSVVKTGARQR